MWFNCSLIQSLWTFVEGVFLRLKGRNIKFASKPCEPNLPDPSGITAVEYGKPPLKVDSLFDGIMENQCKQWIKKAVDSISMRETHAITKNPVDTYPLNCKALGPIFQGNPYMTSYSPPLTHGRLSCWHSRCKDSIKAMGGTTSNEAGGADGTPLIHMDPPQKNWGGPIRR